MGKKLKTWRLALFFENRFGKRWKMTGIRKTFRKIITKQDICHRKLTIANEFTQTQNSNTTFPFYINRFYWQNDVDQRFSSGRNIKKRKKVERFSKHFCIFPPPPPTPFNTSLGLMPVRLTITDFKEMYLKNNNNNKTIACK